MCSQTTASATSKWLEDIKSSKKISFFELCSDHLISSIVFFLTIIMVSECPIISTSTLLINCILFCILPFYTTFCYLFRIDTILHNFRFHINKDWISCETFYTFAISLKVSAYKSLFKKFTTISNFFKECLKEWLAHLVPTLTNLDSQHRHVFLIWFYLIIKQILNP